MYKMIFFECFSMCVLRTGWWMEIGKIKLLLISVQSIIYYLQTFQMTLLLNKFCLDIKKYVNLVPTVPSLGNTDIKPCLPWQ